MAAPAGTWFQQGSMSSPETNAGGAPFVGGISQGGSSGPHLHDAFTIGANHDLVRTVKSAPFASKHCRPGQHKFKKLDQGGSGARVAGGSQDGTAGVRYASPQRSAVPASFPHTPVQAMPPLAQPHSQTHGYGTAPAGTSSAAPFGQTASSYYAVPLMPHPSTQPQPQYSTQAPVQVTVQPPQHQPQQHNAHPSQPPQQQQQQQQPPLMSHFGPPPPLRQQYTHYTAASTGVSMTAVPRPTHPVAQAAFNAVMQAAQQANHTHPGQGSGVHQAYQQTYQQVMQQMQNAVKSATQAGFNFNSAPAPTQAAAAPTCWPGSDPAAPKFRWECHLGAGVVVSHGAEGPDSEWTSYDEHISAQLEAAHKDGKASLRFATRGFLYEVDLTRFLQKNTETGKVRPIRRVTEVQVEFVDEERGSVLAWPFADKGSSRIVLYKKPTPKTVEFENFVERCRKAGWERDVSFWDSTHLACEMKGRHGDHAVVRVGFGTPEYLAVQEKFALVEGVDGNGQRVMAKHATLANSILSIFRLQNSTQMERYCKLKDSISNSLVKTGRSGTEQVLWHGPSSLAAMEGIVVRGFDRMFSHRGANAYGKGCYFARDLMIADRYAASVYSEVDKRTCHVVILAKVLVGEYTLGTKDMYPPPMKPGSMDLYDSTVNNMDNPSIFVTYQDYQAIPYYVITYSSPFAKPSN